MTEGNDEHLSQLGRYKDVFMAGYIANETGLLKTAATSATYCQNVRTASWIPRESRLRK